MNNEFIAAIGCIVLMFVGLAAGLSGLVFLAACATIVIGCYSAYYYKGQKNYWYPVGVIGSFILFVASSAYPGGIVCTLLMFVFLGVVLYFAWYANHAESKAFGGIINRPCPNCGHILGLQGSLGYCPNCGSKIDTTV